MSKPIVAIVGRPNVGKSTLFNVLAGSRIFHCTGYSGCYKRQNLCIFRLGTEDLFTMIDTGGIEPDSKDIILQQMREQAQIAIDTADVICFVVDVKQGLTTQDDKVATMLRKSGKPVVLVVNKVDSYEKEITDVYEFYNLGLGDPFPVSATSKTGIGDMLDEVVSHFPQETGEEEEDDKLKIAVVGKPNVGKSSLINRLVGKNRLIVSDIAGTTRDAIDTTVKHYGKEYTFIDTAGLRRKSKIKEDIERFSIIRTVTAAERADIVVLMIDATEGVTEQDAKIAGIAHERGKGLIIAVNKWDAVEDKETGTMKEMTEKIKSTLSFCPYAEVIFISVLTGRGIDKVFNLIDIVNENQNMRIQTGTLNEILTRALAMQETPQDKGKHLRIYYMTQVSVATLPTFVIFVNDKNLTHFSYTRYIENNLRNTFGFRGTSLRFIYREREDSIRG